MGVHSAKMVKSGVATKDDAEDSKTADSYLADYARHIIRARREATKFLPRVAFHDEAWDMLLELFVANAEGRSVSIKLAILSTELPSTTALRIIERLETAELVERIPVETDRRRVNLQLTPEGRLRLSSMLLRLSSFCR